MDFGILFLWIPIIVLLVWGIRRHQADSYEERGLFTSIVSGLAATALLLVCIIEPIVSGAQVAQYTTFHETNFSNYGVAISESASYLSSEEFTGTLIAGSIERFGLGGYVSERIAEWRDDVNQYNIDVARYKYYSTHPFIGILKPDLPAHILPLTIEGE